ncbi:MAG: hypothetical protein ACE5JD_08755 [Candidatus Methylomirabilia bacterium]
MPGTPSLQASGTAYAPAALGERRERPEILQGHGCLPWGFHTKVWTIRDQLHRTTVSDPEKTVLEHLEVPLGAGGPAAEEVMTRRDPAHELLPLHNPTADLPGGFSEGQAARPRLLAFYCHAEGEAGCLAGLQPEAE